MPGILIGGQGIFFCAGRQRSQTFMELPQIEIDKASANPVDFGDLLHISNFSMAVLINIEPSLAVIHRSASIAAISALRNLGAGISRGSRYL